MKATYSVLLSTMTSVVPECEQPTSLSFRFGDTDCNVAHYHVCLLVAGVLQDDDFVVAEVELGQVVYHVCFVILNLVDVAIVMHALFLTEKIVMLAHDHNGALLVMDIVLRLSDAVNQWVHLHYLLVEFLAN